MRVAIKCFNERGNGDPVSSIRSAHDGNQDFDNLLGNEQIIRNFMSNHLCDIIESQSDLLHFSANSQAITHLTEQGNYDFDLRDFRQLHKLTSQNQLAEGARQFS